MLYLCFIYALPMGDAGRSYFPQKPQRCAEVNCGKPHLGNVVNTENEGERTN